MPRMGQDRLVLRRSINRGLWIGGKSVPGRGRPHRAKMPGSCQFCCGSLFYGCSPIRIRRGPGAESNQEILQLKRSACSLLNP